MPNCISEDTIEQAILKRLHEQFGFELLSCYTSDAKREIDGLIHDGIPVEFKNAQGKKEEEERVRVIDFTPGSSTLHCFQCHRNQSRQLQFTLGIFLQMAAGGKRERKG